MPTFHLIIFIIGALPVIGYPMILFVNIVSLSGLRPKSDPRFMVVMMKIFLWSTTLYPITYFFALYKYRNTSAESHYIWTGLILTQILVIYLSFKGWTISEKTPKKNKFAAIDPNEEKKSEE